VRELTVPLGPPYGCMHACMYVCMDVCMDVYMDVCMYVCMYVLVEGWVDEWMGERTFKDVSSNQTDISYIQTDTHKGVILCTQKYSTQKYSS